MLFISFFFISLSKPTVCNKTQWINQTLNRKIFILLILKITCMLKIDLICIFNPGKFVIILFLVEFLNWGGKKKTCIKVDFINILVFLISIYQYREWSLTDGEKKRVKISEMNNGFFVLFLKCAAKSIWE